MVLKMLKLISDFVNDDNSEDCECSNRNSQSVFDDKFLGSQKHISSKSKVSYSPALHPGENIEGSNRIASHSSCPKTASLSVQCPNEQNPISHSRDVPNEMPKSPKKAFLSSSNQTPQHFHQKPLSQLFDKHEFDDCDIKLKKSVTFARNTSDRDIIQLDKASDDMDCCDSPSSDEYADRFKLQQRKYLNGDVDVSTPQDSPILLQSHEDSPVYNERVTPNLSHPRNSHMTNTNLHSSKRVHISPECVVTGEKTIFQKSNEQSKRCDEIYNRNLVSSQQVVSKSVKKNRISPDLSGHDISDDIDKNDDCNDNLDSTGGKLPHYGPRRTNYRAICKLANSKYKDLDAVHIGGVRCTFRSFGESVTQGGSKH
ncbi:hypothetical protein ACP4OV_030187 [Aristida adscensionis]